MAAPRAQRADARRNVAAILDAATECLARDPDTSIAGIAAAAGVGRITLYGHFKTRADLVDAVLVRTVRQCDAILDATDTPGDPADARGRGDAGDARVGITRQALRGRVEDRGDVTARIGLLGSRSRHPKPLS